MGNLARILVDMINPEAAIINDEQRTRPGNSEVERLMGNNEKIKKLTGWNPDYTLDSGLKETIEWFKNKENLRLYKTKIYNV